MMMNLFSSFNPSSWMNLPMNWMTMIIMPTIMMNKMWMINSKMMTTYNKFIKFMYNQFENLITKTMKMNIMIMLTMMMMIMLMNTSSLFPYIYAPTAMPHLCISMSLPMWMAINLNKMKNPNKIMSNLLPKNTPTPLVPMMILIETTSMMIQPLTLSVRLMANITAGHILMILISTSYSLKSMIPSMMVQMVLSLMEMCVALIQAYVFSMLLIMFNK